MKTAERIVLILIPIVLLGGGIWIYLSVQNNQQELRESVARGDFQIPLPDQSTDSDTTNWRKYYPVTVPVVIGTTSVQASLADSLSERIKGLSETPFLPEGVVKLFAFGVPGKHSMWMKDMNYPLDIIWTNEEGVIIHIEENIAPDTYPDSFSSPTPAWYVVETNAGFVAANNISRGDTVVIIADE